jgi:FtsH-binding integral membrane protein
MSGSHQIPPPPTGAEVTRLKIWQGTLAAFVTVTYWVSVLALPERGNPWPIWLRWVTGLVGLALLILGPTRIWKGLQKTGAEEREERGQHVALGGAILLVGVILVVLAFLTSVPLVLKVDNRFAIGVGGAALAGFAFALSLFDSMRAAASIPIVILLIGVVVWPEASTLVEESVKQAVITWMGVILAANGIAEASKQIGESNAKAKADPDQTIESAGDLRRR